MTGRDAVLARQACSSWLQCDWILSVPSQVRPIPDDIMRQFKRGFDLRNQKKKRQTHNKERDFCEGRQGSDFKLKRTGGLVGSSFRRATLMFADRFHKGFAFRGRRDRCRQTKMIWNKEWSTQHTHHTQLKDWSSTHLLFEDAKT